MKITRSFLKVPWLLLWLLPVPGLQGQVLWGKFKVGMTQQEVAALEPAAQTVTEMKKLATGLVAKMRLPGVKVAGLTGEADFYFQADSLRQISITFTEQETFEHAHQQFQELRRHLQTERKNDPAVKSQRGDVNMEMAAWDSDNTIITLSLVGALTRPQLGLHFQSAAFMREIAARSPEPSTPPKYLLSEQTKAKAEQGDAEAQFEVAISYLPPGGQNPAEAVRWLHRAAEQKHVKAQTMLGASYIQGRGVAKDSVEGIRWLQQAGEAGDAQAQNALGFCYATGQGVRLDHTLALKWYGKAADQRDPQALYNIGDCYRMGLGVRADMNEAVKWYRKAAAENYPPALKILQEMTRRGPR